MPNGDLNWIANFIWGIADDVLRDVYVRGNYRDVILPMTVIRRLDACLESTKQDVLKMSEQLDKAGVAARSQLLKDVMRDYGYLEDMGMGVPRKIVKEMQKHNGTAPDLIEDGELFTVRLWKK